jgi:hypothetical protein
MGMLVFEHSVDVTEVNERHHAARKFVKRHKRRIYLDRITDQKNVPSAIRVIGKSKGWFFERSKCIGYLPADIADKLIRTNLGNKVKVQIHMILIDDKATLNIRFDIFGPKDDYEKYSSIC